jgi:hypothetical protein
MESVKRELREGCPSRVTAKNITMSSQREPMLITFKLSSVHALLAYQFHINLTFAVPVHLLLAL